jgi:hypothetical protein
MLVANCDQFQNGMEYAEKKELVTNCDRFRTLKHSSVLPRAFTEQGVANVIFSSKI